MAEPERWKPNVTVAAVIERDGRYLLVEEGSPRGPVLNNPAGHLDPGESLVEAVVREVLEETACRFAPTHLVGIYLASAAPGDTTYLRFAFAGSVGEPEPGRALDDGILRTLWLTPAEIDAEHARHRSPLLARCVADHQGDRRYPLEMLHDLGSLPRDRGVDSQPLMARKGPFAVNVEAGKDYLWCACGRSKTQPFCDGSHKATPFTPVKYTAAGSGTVYFCGCKRTLCKPVCDTTHKSL